MTRLNVMILLDRSGSMTSFEGDVVKSINKYLKSLKRDNAFISLNLFDSHGGELSMDKVIDNCPASKAKFRANQFEPRGMTPLNDAMKQAIEELEEMTAKDELSALVFSQMATRTLLCASQAIPYKN